MDLERALRELYEEKKRLDRAVARIEARLAMMSDPPRKSTRGRKNMGTEERLQVSARMTAYWASRRAQLGKKSERSAVQEAATAAVDGPAAGPEMDCDDFKA